MTKPTRAEVEKMSRSEQIEYELRLAAEHGLSPKRKVHLAPSFTAQESTPARFSPGSTQLPTSEEIRANDLDVRRIVTGPDAVPDSMKPLLFKESPRALYESIVRNLDVLSDNNRYQLLQAISEQLRNFQLQATDTESDEIAELQQRVSRAVFGIEEFEDLPNQNGGAMSPKEQRE